MAPRGSKTHYLRENLDNRLPRRHIFLDTEAEITYDPSRHEQSQAWLCGVARYMDADTRRSTPKLTDTDYVDPGSLWADVSTFTRPNSRTLLWAHNLAYDLRIAQTFDYLPQFGFSLQAIVLDGGHCWARFRDDGGRSLVMCDFASWASVPLARIADMVGMVQAPLPDDPGNDLPGAFERCRGDVRILHRAVSETLQWVEREKLGNFQITGAGQAWNAYRHRFLTEKILVHNHPKVRADERRSIWAGRTEAWRHGTAPEPVFEFDLPRAYATIARDCALPTVYVGTLPRVSLRNFKEYSRSRHLLSNVSIVTDSPIVPTHHDDRVVWPIGEFRTTLWDCEVHALLQAGASVRIHRTHVYTSTRCLRDWASWILESLLPESDGVTALQRRILKQWSRSLIGRFALQYRSWEPTGTSDESDLFLSKVVGPGEPKGAQLMQVGKDILELGGLTESENSLPQITGYITAMCRVRLWELMNVAGLDNLYYVDTDSLIVNATGANNLRIRMEQDGAYGLVFKSEARKMEILGPRQITVDGELRYSGIPKRSKPVGDHEVTGEVWEGLGQALRHGRSDKVIVHERTFTLRGSDSRRIWNPDGTTGAVRLARP